MPQVAAGAVLAGVVSGSAYAAGALTIGFSLSAFASSLVLGGLSYALSPKPKKPSGGGGSFEQQPGTFAVRQSDLTRTIIYGSSRAVRGYAHMVSTNTNKDLHLIIMLGQGEITGIREIWVDDYAIPEDAIDASGNVISGRYEGHMKIKMHLGATDQVADADAVANIPEWTANHRLRGIAYLYVVLYRDQDVFPNGVPNITAIVDGVAIYDPRTATSQFTTNMALLAYDWIGASYGFAARAADVDLVNIAAQASICDEIVTVTSEPFTASAVDDTTDIITISGDVLTLQYGDVIRVSSTGSLPTGLSAGVDYYVIPYQVKTTPRLMLATSLANAMARTQINLTSAGSGSITITKTGEPRYHGGGEIDTADEIGDTLGALVTCMAGRAINVAGKWTLLAGAWRAPVIELTADDVRGSGANIKTCLSMSESYNRVQGLFNGPGTNYQETNYPSAFYSQFLTDDGEVEAIKELNLPFCSRPTAAQRIAKIELFRGRQEIAFSSDYSTKALQLQCGDTAGITLDKYGFASKIFECTSFAFDANDDAVVTKLGFRETAEAIYDWSAGEAITFDPAPNTTLTDPYTVIAPTGVAYNSRFIETSGGDSIYSLQLLWDAHPDAFVMQYGDFEIQFKLSAEVDWLPAFFVDGTQIQTDVVTASNGALYDLRIRARNNLGVRSGWSTIYEAYAGSSGGVTVTDDYGAIGNSPVVISDYGLIGDSPTTLDDFGFVV